MLGHTRFDLKGSDYRFFAEVNADNDDVPDYKDVYIATSETDPHRAGDPL
jgi:hypothetical protein